MTRLLRAASRPLRRCLSSLSKLWRLVLLAIAVGGCGGVGGPPNVTPAQMGIVSQDAKSWYILYSAGTTDHPVVPPTAWAIDIPSAGGHLNYVQTPFRTTERPRQIVMTFQVVESADAIPVSSKAPASPCRDHNPCTPVAEFHIFIEQQGDNLSSEIGRWWCKRGFRLTNVSDDSFDAQEFVADGQPHTITIPLSADQWTSVSGHGTPADFETALANIGYVGVTFGGSDFFGEGVDVRQGTAQFRMIELRVE